MDSCKCPTDEEFATFKEHVERRTPLAPDRPKIRWDAIITTIILFYINLLNYMDRSTLSSIAPDLEKVWNDLKWFKIGYEYFFEIFTVCTFPELLFIHVQF